MELLRQSARHVNVGDAERWTSIISGSALLFYGMIRGSLGGLGLVLLGGSLIYRGTTGRCGLYSVLGVNTADDGDYAPDQRASTGDKTVTVNATHE